LGAGFGALPILIGIKIDWNDLKQQLHEAPQIIEQLVGCWMIPWTLVSSVWQLRDYYTVEESHRKYKALFIVCLEAWGVALTFMYDCFPGFLDRALVILVT
jgi:hypothetical protein